MKTYYFIMIAILFILYIIHNIKKGDFSIKESFFWIFGCLVMLILSVFPKSIDFFAEKLGIVYPPSLLFTLCILFLIFIIFKCHKKIAHHEERITALAQEITIIRGELDNKQK